MPLINGMKMACEPCIRGHRSTKCTHANERLMVPVRKPGRPLSACPHPNNQPCGCGSVTAAIPKKQACHCGGGPALATTATTAIETAFIAEPLSPTKTVFRIQKPPKPAIRRKLSFDLANLERIDVTHINLLSFDNGSQPQPATIPSAFSVARSPSKYGPSIKYASNQHPHDLLRNWPRPSVHRVGSSLIADGMIGTRQTSAFAVSKRNGNMSTDMASSTASSDFECRIGNGSCGSVSVLIGDQASDVSENVGSCCDSKINRRLSFPIGHSNGELHSDMARQETIMKPYVREDSEFHSSSDANPPNLNFLSGDKNHSPSAIPLQYSPQTTLFSYPPTYGSFQNPLQPSAWRQGLQVGCSVPFQSTGMSHSTSLPFEETVVEENLNTTYHACGCGDGCQCVGCAAHPYNDATQNYVRSACQSMQQLPTDLYLDASSQEDLKEVQTVQQQNPEGILSSSAHTPSSTTPGTGEEQSLSASDFFFVNYPFMSDQCGGDTQSCPCGDECQCLGCTIHNQPAIPCSGEGTRCPCGDDCECLGCETHRILS